MKNEIKIFSPATVANVSCGFDVLGFALDTVGDEMIIRKVPQKGIQITKINDQNLPLETNKNVAGVAALALLAETNIEFGFEIEINKKIKPGSGIGSSAASSAGAVWAINELLGSPFNTTDLVRFAMEGEKLASGEAHADNVAPAIFGGFTLIRSYNPLDIIKIPTPKDLIVTIIHPQIEIKTSEARKLLSQTVSLKNATKQWANVGGLISGLHTNDYDLIGRSLQDFVAEPVRSKLIPGFNKLKQTCLETGALGCGISGSGPSIFVLSKGEKKALEVSEAMKTVYNKVGIAYDLHVSKVNNKGIKILDTK
ncbi:MAG: homoserine kinase [Lutibacter sp.]|uniref:homoserine kinase n=1 Tax=Lutibacter sp. TaxID=1925666 RepID=UPI00299D3033|nr:homoserine kinase [Lutibacter sp.]MDX1828082.1 homoserine kinase [Lutibacter sp.]